MDNMFVITTCEVVERGYDRCLQLLDELKMMSYEERVNLYQKHQEWFSSKEKIDLESLVVKPRPSSLERFRLWFYLIGGEFLVGPSAGEWNYEKYLKAYPKRGMNSYKFPHMVLLAFSMMGYIDGLKSNYSNSKTVRVDGLSGFGRRFWLNLPKVYGFIDDYADWFNVSASKGWSGKMERFATFEVEDVTWNSYPEWQAKWQKKSISALTLIPEAKTYAENILKKYEGFDIFGAIEKEKKDSKRKGKRKDKSEVVNAYMLNLTYNKLKFGDIGSFKIDKYAGRCYTIVTNMASAFRLKYLRLEDEQVAEVDVGSAQPFFLGLRILKEKSVRSIWLDACLNYDFYEYIKRVTGFKGERKHVKKHLMHYIYSYNDQNKTDKPRYYKNGYALFAKNLDEFLKTYDKVAYDYIQHFKNNPIKGKNGELKSELPKMMQREEVEYIQQCLKELAGKVLCYNIHDCVCCKMSDAAYVKEVMLQVGIERYGVEMRINIETEETEVAKNAPATHKYNITIVR